MANSKIYLGSTNIGSLFQGVDDISIYLGDNKVYPLAEPVFDGKWKATYQDSHVESAECDSSSEIAMGEINPDNLVSVEIGDCVTSIGFMAFFGCESLTSVTIGSGVTSIGNDAFNMCTSLTSIVIPSGVTSIGNSAFRYCSSLTSIGIPNSVTSIGDDLFYDCSRLSSIDIPDSVTSIGNDAFRDCRSLTSIVIPSGVTSIGNDAFRDCSSLTSVTVKATIPPTLSNSPFENTDDCPIYVPSASLTDYQTAWPDYEYRIQPIP